MSGAEVKDFLARIDEGNRGFAISLEHLGDEARRSFADASVARWLRLCRDLSQAGLGNSVTLSYVRHSPEIARLVGEQAAFDLVESMKTIAYAAGRRAAQRLPGATAAAARRLQDEAAVRAWLATVERLAPQIPESLALLLERTDRILSRLDVGRFETWTIGGIRAAGGDPARRQAFFSFADPAAERMM
ncbi:MAG: hypothetical protein D6826_06320, partial [Alphaproteobacteria bacterium]